MQQECLIGGSRLGEIYVWGDQFSGLTVCTPTFLPSCLRGIPKSAGTSLPWGIWQPGEEGMGGGNYGSR